VMQSMIQNIFSSPGLHKTIQETPLSYL